MNTEMLAPAAALIVWTLIMLLWASAVRLPALTKLDMPKEKSRGARGSDLDGVLPDEIQWKAHNYNHLMEQPTIFYATCVILALAGAGELDIWLAWGYVLLRVLHSVWQAVVNTIPVRLALFTIGSIMLIIMGVRALLAVI